MKYLFLMISAILFSFNADAAVKVKNDTANKYAKQIAEANSMSSDDEAVIATLENDIKILDEEIAKCEKQKKGWIAATVIGSVGVASTGIAAAVQGAQISDKKDTLDDKTKELKRLKEKSKSLDEE